MGCIFDVGFKFMYQETVKAWWLRAQTQSLDLTSGRVGSRCVTLGNLHNFFVPQFSHQ